MIKISNTKVVGFEEAMEHFELTGYTDKIKNGPLYSHKKAPEEAFYLYKPMVEALMNIRHDNPIMFDYIIRLIKVYAKIEAYSSFWATLAGFDVTIVGTGSPSNDVRVVCFDYGQLLTIYSYMHGDSRLKGHEDGETFYDWITKISLYVRYDENGHIEKPLIDLLNQGGVDMLTEINGVRVVGVEEALLMLSLTGVVDKEIDYRELFNTKRHENNPLKPIDETSYYIDKKAADSMKILRDNDPETFHYILSLIKVYVRIDSVVDWWNTLRTFWQDVRTCRHGIIESSVVTFDYNQLMTMWLILRDDTQLRDMTGLHIFYWFINEIPVYVFDDCDRRKLMDYLN